MAASTPKRYPFSTADGQAIPVEIIRPLGVIVVAFNPDTAVEVDTIPDPTPVLFFHASRDCIVEFADAAGSLVDGEVLANSIYVPGGLALVVSPPSFNIFVKGIEESGRLVIQLVDDWIALNTEEQLRAR